MSSLKSHMQNDLTFALRSFVTYDTVLLTKCVLIRFGVPLASDTLRMFTGQS